MSSGLPEQTRVHTVAMDPLAPKTLYLGTSSNNVGVYKSIDGGNTWAASGMGLSNKAVVTLVVDPASSNMIYAGTEGGGIFKSVNGGNNWNAVNTGLSAANIKSLVVDPGGFDVPRGVGPLRRFVREDQDGRSAHGALRSDAAVHVGDAVRQFDADGHAIAWMKVEHRVGDVEPVVVVVVRSDRPDLEAGEPEDLVVVSRHDRLPVRDPRDDVARDLDRSVPHALESPTPARPACFRLARPDLALRPRAWYFIPHGHASPG